jgi:hypothetical protein
VVKHQTHLRPKQAVKVKEWSGLKY